MSTTWKQRRRLVCFEYQYTTFDDLRKPLERCKSISQTRRNLRTNIVTFTDRCETFILPPTRSREWVIFLHVCVMKISIPKNEGIYILHRITLYCATEQNSTDLS